MTLAGTETERPFARRRKRDWVGGQPTAGLLFGRNEPSVMGACWSSLWSRRAFRTALFVKEPATGTELPGELADCDQATPCKLQVVRCAVDARGCTARRWPEPMWLQASPATRRGPACGRPRPRSGRQPAPADEVSAEPIKNMGLRQLHPEAPRWDENGYRLSPAPSVFPRQPVQVTGLALVTLNGAQAPSAAHGKAHQVSERQTAPCSSPCFPLTLPSGHQKHRQPQPRPARRIFIAGTRNLR
jgi:hypothetical protein